MKYIPEEQVFWTMQQQLDSSPLQKDISTEIVIIGGGMAGLSAADYFLKQGKKVVVLERSFCGAGASGKSTGFVTPNAELGLTHYVDAYGPEKARKIWHFVTSGVEQIRSAIREYGIACDYVEEDTVVVANSPAGLKELALECQNLQSLNFSCELLSQQDLQSRINAPSYYGGITYPRTFGINVFAYLQGMKKMLAAQGVTIFEDTPALTIAGNQVKTSQGSVSAEHIVVCVDRAMQELNIVRDKIYQVETFILCSSPLTNEQVAALFAHKRFMIWDTDFVYQYFRLTGDNRLLIGGSTLLRSFHIQTPYVPSSVYKKLAHYVAKRFPQIHVEFEYMWPGYIGVSKDLQPLVGQDATNKNLYYATAATGLPWAAALGTYVGQCILEHRSDMDEFFSPHRSFYFDGFMQKIMGKANAFSLSNLLSLKE